MCGKKDAGPDGEGGPKGGNFKKLIECAMNEDKTAKEKMEKLKAMPDAERKQVFEKIIKCKEDAVA